MNPYPERDAWGGVAKRFARRFCIALKNVHGRELRLADTRKFKKMKSITIWWFRAPDVWGVHENTFKIAQNLGQS